MFHDIKKKLKIQKKIGANKNYQENLKSIKLGNEKYKIESKK